jgi:hypothetical protein
LRKADGFLKFILVNFLLLALMWGYSRYQAGEALERLGKEAITVQKLQITDLCLFTEAWYTRHPSQSDWHNPFQSHPVCLEHFPTGSIVRPPDLLRKTNGNLD